MDAEHVNEQFHALTGTGLEDEITEAAIEASVERTMGHLASDFVLLASIKQEMQREFKWSPGGSERAAMMLYGRLMDRGEYGAIPPEEDE